MEAGLNELAKALESDPTNVSLANHYWNALGNYKGHDIRTGRDVVGTYRRPAVATIEGVIAFANAYEELFELSGELPRRDLFDDELIDALVNKMSEIGESDRVTVEWMLTTIKESA